MRKALPVLAAWVLIVAHSEVLAFMVAAIIGMQQFPVDRATLQAHGIQPWTLYYGPIAAVVEAVVLIALAVGVLRRSLRAGNALIVLLPLAIVHGIACSLYLEFPLQGVLFTNA